MKCLKVSVVNYYGYKINNDDMLILLFVVVDFCLGANNDFVLHAMETGFQLECHILTYKQQLIAFESDSEKLVP